MQVTRGMLEAAMKQAVQTGLLPKYADEETYLNRWNSMNQCIQAAIDASREETPNAALSDIITTRDECRTAQRDLIAAADPTGDARLAYGVVADQLTALIKRHGG